MEVAREGYVGLFGWRLFLVQCPTAWAHRGSGQLHCWSSLFAFQQSAWGLRAREGAAAILAIRISPLPPSHEPLQSLSPGLHLTSVWLSQQMAMWLPEES